LVNAYDPSEAVVVEAGDSWTSPGANATTQTPLTSAPPAAAVTVPLIVPPSERVPLMADVEPPAVTATTFAELCDALVLYHCCPTFSEIPHPAENSTS
jgi:hypothetical protein